MIRGREQLRRRGEGVGRSVFIRVAPPYFAEGDFADRRNPQVSTVQVRYIVNDVDAAVAFYTAQLGFKLEMHPAPAFAMLSRGDLRLVLSAPNPMGGGGQSMPDGTVPQPGGWNRFAIEVEDLAAMVEGLRKGGAHFRNQIVTGVGGKQIIVEDPSGNPIELFQPTIPEARLKSRSP
jgi:catechol 2,3-dioxygenase-like lactoylglutathione lyase family enzyme